MKATLQNLNKALLVLHSPIDETVGIENAAQIFQAARHPKSFISLDKALKDAELTDPDKVNERIKKIFEDAFNIPLTVDIKISEQSRSELDEEIRKRFSQAEELEKKNIRTKVEMIDIGITVETSKGSLKF